MDGESGYDGLLGTAGGWAFGEALQAAARERGFGDAVSLAEASGLESGLLERVFRAEARLAVPALARLAHALRLRPIEFLQTTQLLSLEVYAFGLDPLYFLPPGQIRHDARIYMREINPRHPVPEGDMTKRNPTLKALAEDAVLDQIGKLEVELAYLLRGAVQATGGSL